MFKSNLIRSHLSLYQDWQKTQHSADLTILLSRGYSQSRVANVHGTHSYLILVPFHASHQGYTNMRTKQKCSSIVFILSSSFCFAYQFFERTKMHKHMSSHSNVHKKKKKHRSFVVQCKISGKLHYAWINNIKWISTDRLCCFYFILRYSSLFLSSATNWLLYDTQCRTGNRARARSCLPCMCDACHFQVLFNIFTKLIYHRSVLHFDRFGDRIRFVGSHTKYLVLLNWEGVRSGNITT